MIPRMTTPPYTTQDQFMVTAVTGTEGGKKEKTRVMIVYTAAYILIARPHRPSFHGPKAIGSFRSRLKIMMTMGIRYEER